ncbi:prenyltransferase/squalene oxidase repeat-containing protein [Roseimaritima sediminicola]|uniref:prenyltransferase/squalene oxidase repeat-containing protein n=1 Tax=Roseimaritima sediminicola TaxID=2662066 RepID=UPI001386BA6C|nr:prenyltransferase/squalene oxidase repeat-containing protein [Roseimaritima sediminicola]
MTVSDPSSDTTPPFDAPPVQVDADMRQDDLCADSAAAPPVQPDSSVALRWHFKRFAANTWAGLRADHVRLPAWLVSTILHTILLIVLALLSVPHAPGGRTTLLVQTSPPADETAADLEHLQQPDPLEPDDSLAAEQPSEIPVASPAPPQVSVRSPLEPQVSQRNAVEAAAAAMAQQQQHVSAQPLPTGGGLGGRTPEGRREWGLRRGATPESEAAVERALEWLIAHQRKDGSWSFDLSGAPCDGRCANPRENPDRLPAPPTAATGLALLAFLGAGYTHESGPYREQIDRALYYLRGQMRPTEFGSDLQLGSMYGHGIATLAVVEAASMTGDPELRHMAEELVGFIVAARHPSGSWGYTPGAPGDITLTAWQVKALKGADRLNISMPSDIFARSKAYIDSLSPDAGVHFGYREPSEAKTPTAIGLAMQIYLGRSPLDRAQQDGMEQLLRWGPTHRNVYHDYYASLALHHASHPRWKEWHPQVRDHLVQTQARQGHEEGSWNFRDHYGDVGGRLYTTAMCAMILEVYYRYLPLYAENSEFPL